MEKAEVGSAVFTGKIEKDKKECCFVFIHQNTTVANLKNNNSEILSWISIMFLENVVVQ